MCEVPQRPRESIVGAVVCRIRERVSSHDCCGAMGGIRRVVDEVDFAQQSLLMMLGFAHHFTDLSQCGAVWCDLG